MKTLVIVAHPDIEKSKINKRWIEELEKYSMKLRCMNCIKWH